MKVYELINVLKDLPAGATVRVLEEGVENGAMGDVTNTDADGEGSDGVVTLFFTNEAEE